MQYHYSLIIKLYFFIVLFFCFGFSATAQAHYTISGTVVGQKDEPVKSATVFLSGTKRMTHTDDKGHFTFADLVPGAYKIVAKQFEYAAVAKSVMLQKNIDLPIKITIPTPVPKRDLTETVVDRAIKIRLFERSLIGASDNGLSCTIKNPEVLNLKDNLRNSTLQVTSNDVLTIENKSLGYTVKYLIHALTYDYGTRSIKFDGDAWFEELQGTDRTNDMWKQNRMQAYNGSLMHFLRSVFNGPDDPVKEGFLTQSVTSTIDYMMSFSALSQRASAFVVPKPISFDTLVNVVDTTFMAIKFKQPLAITYNPQKTSDAKKLASLSSKPEKIVFSTNISGLRMGDVDAVFDSRGNIANAFPFLTIGHWSGMGIGDQLPLEYTPDKH